MITQLSTETATSLLTRIAASFFGHLRSPPRSRVSRVGIAALLELDPIRLDDLGLTLGDVQEALAAPAEAGRHLTVKRAQRARDWYFRKPLST